jgi:hypothetical protein
MIAIPGLTMMTWLKIGATGAVVAFAVTSCVMRDNRIATQAVEKAVVKIEKANTNAAKKGTRAAERSRDPGVRGPIDPTTRD